MLQTITNKPTRDGNVCKKAGSLLCFAARALIQVGLVTNTGLLRPARSWRVLGLALALVCVSGTDYSRGQEKPSPGQEKTSSAAEAPCPVASSSPCPPGSTPPPSGLLAWWSMNEGSGATTLLDRAGGDNNAETIGGPTGNGGPNPIIGEFVRCSMHFTYSRYAVVSAANSTNLNFGPNNNFSIDAWIKIPPTSANNTASDNITIVFKRTPLGNGYSLSFSQNTDSNPTDYKLRLDVGSVFRQWGQIPVGKWTFVAATVNRRQGASNHVTLYYGVAGGDLNGPFQAGSLPPPADAANPTTPLVIGKMGQSPHAQIFIDELEIFSRELRPVEVKRIFKAGKKGKCSNNQPPE